jgi:hypothetical protein
MWMEEFGLYVRFWFLHVCYMRQYFNILAVKGNLSRDLISSHINNLHLDICNKSEAGLQACNNSWHPIYLKIWHFQRNTCKNATDVILMVNVLNSTNSGLLPLIN